jgi:hypothetical protein
MTMKRLFMMTAALLALTGVANAGAMPKYLAKLSGPIWCEQSIQWEILTVVQLTGRDGDKCWNPKAQPSRFWIDADGFGWRNEIVCTPVRISSMRERGSYTLEWTITANCKYSSGSSGSQTFTFDLFKGHELTYTQSR